MKKKQFLSTLLTIALVFTMVFAGADAVFAATTTDGTDTITAVNINAKDEAPVFATLTYNVSTPDSIKVEIPKTSTVQFGIIATANSYVNLYDAAGQRVYGYGTSVEASLSQQDYKYATFPNVSAGTYTVEMTSAGGDAAAAIAALYYPQGGTPKKGVDFYGASPDGKVAYYKITAPSTGYITAEFTDSFNGGYPNYQVKLFSSSKKALFKKGYENVGSSKDYKTRIGVTKGTYYVGVKTSDPYYAVNLKFTAVSEKSGSTKAKAAKLTKGKTKRGIITASQSSTSGDWYKFTISKAQKVNLEISTLTSQGGGYGGLKYTITGSNSYTSLTGNLYYSRSGSTINLYTYGYGGKLAPGTYYIKIQKYNDGNGYYKLKWR